MRLPRFRFTIRAYMIALAVVTVLVAAGVQAVRWMQLREGYLYAVEYHEEKERDQRQTLNNLAIGRSRGFGGDPLFPIMEDLARRRLAFHSEMKEKWRRAAARPWIAVSDDPDAPTDDRIVKSFDLLPMPKKITDDVQYFDPATVRASTGVEGP